MADEYSFPKGDLMAGKTGLVMGVANHNSIAYGIASQLAAQGARLAFAYLPDMEKRVRPLANEVGGKLVLPCDVSDEASMSAVFDTLAKEWRSLDFVVHAIAYSDKDELKGKYVDTTRANFLQTLDVSCYSFTEVCRRAAALMPRPRATSTRTASRRLR